MPQVSIIIPIRNRAAEIGRIFQVFESQDNKDFELVFVDDGSEDETQKTLAAAQSDLSFTVERIPHSGPSAARNRGARTSSAPYLIFFDSDDDCAPNYVARFLEAVDSDAPQLVMAGVRTSYADGKPDKLELPENSVISGPIPRPFLSGTFCIERELFWSVGGYTEKLRYAENRELALKLACSPLLDPQRITVIAEPLYLYQCRESSARSYYKERALAAEYILKQHPIALKKANLSLTYRRLALTAHAKSGNITATLKHSARLVRAYPQKASSYVSVAKAAFHVSRRLTSSEKLHTLVWFLKRPALYPELVRLTLKRVLPPGPQGGSPEEARAWCAERALTAAQAVERLSGSSFGSSVEELFPEDFGEARRAAENCPARMGGAADLDLLYHLCEAFQARTVIETGVAYGWSSLALLLSLKSRDQVQLQSTDMPYPKRGNDDFVGCVVPSYLRPLWTLIRLPDREGLPKALKAAQGPLDLIHYDSDKSYGGRMWAYPLLWNALRPGGVFVSDDIRDNTAFRDFAQSLGLEPTVVQCEDKYVGVLLKPGL